MITLYQMPRMGLSVMNPSPFCMKVETYLRMAGLPYRTEETLDLRKAPKGKLPWIMDGGRAIADSQHIVDHLQRAHGRPLLEPVDADDPATAHAMRRMLEESLYFALVYARWMYPPGWRQTRRLFFGALPAPARAVVAPMAHRGMVKQLRAQGYGRHEADDVFAMGAADLSALDRYLSDRSWASGDRPGLLDAIAYAFVCNIVEVPIDTPLARHARGCSALMQHVDRMSQRLASVSAGQRDRNGDPPRSVTHPSP